MSQQVIFVPMPLRISLRTRKRTLQNSFVMFIPIGYLCQTLLIEFLSTTERSILVPNHIIQKSNQSDLQIKDHFFTKLSISRNKLENSMLEEITNLINILR